MSLLKATKRYTTTANVFFGQVRITNYIEKTPAFCNVRLKYSDINQGKI